MGSLVKEELFKGFSELLLPPAANTGLFGFVLFLFFKFVQVYCRESVCDWWGGAERENVNQTLALSVEPDTPHGAGSQDPAITT